MLFLKVFLLIISLWIDGFICSFSYGFDGIKINKRMIFFISFLCSLFLIFSMFIGLTFTSFVSKKITNIISFIILFMIGFIKIIICLINYLINKKCNGMKILHLSFSNLKIVLNVYSEVFNADRDYSFSLSFNEAIILSLALSFDNIGVGISLGMIYSNYIFILLLSLIIGLISIMSGYSIGKKLSNRINYDLSFISGFILIMLALFRL